MRALKQDCEPRSVCAPEFVELRFSSACTLTTVETVIECELAIASLLRVYPLLPVFVVVDEGAEAHLKACEFTNVTLVRGELKRPAVRDLKTYHRPEVLLWKMQAMEAALTTYPDTLFFDGDLVFLAELTVTTNEASVMLSHSNSVRGELARTGVFNGGLLWTKNKNFPNWWRQRWLSPERQKDNELYEQTALNDVPQHLPVGYFAPSHNIGFWQGDIGKRKVSSLHGHLSPCLDGKMDGYCLQEVKAFREQMWKVLEAPELTELRGMALAVLGQRALEARLR